MGDGADDLMFREIGLPDTEFFTGRRASIKPVYCEDCENVTEESKKGHVRYRECRMHPRLNDGYVSKSERVSSPYLYCKDVNGGSCPLYQPKEIEE